MSYDLLKRMIELVQECQPSLTEEMALQIEQQLVAEFRGETIRITTGKRTYCREIKDQVRKKFNGRNAKEIAREFGIGRATVYRLVKREGGS